MQPGSTSTVSELHLFSVEFSLILRAQNIREACVCVGWVYRVCMKQTRQEPCGGVNVGPPTCCSVPLTVAGLQGCAAAGTRRHRARLFLCHCCHVTPPVSSPVGTEIVDPVAYRPGPKAAVVIVWLTPNSGAFRNPATPHPALGNTWCRRSHSVHRRDCLSFTFGKHWQADRSQIRCLPTSNTRWFQFYELMIEEEGFLLRLAGPLISKFHL